MRIGFGLDVARLNVDETVTGLWSFTNVAGVLIDDINPVTPALGVLIDGVLLKAKAAFMRSLVLATDTVLGSAVAGDGFDRFEVLADGRQVWGDGAGAVDTNLYRDAANVLKTDDSLEVGGALGVASILTAEHDFKATRRLFVSGSGNVALNPVENAAVISSTVMQRRTSDGGGTFINGITGVANDLMIYYYNIGLGSITFVDESVAAVTFERVKTPNAANYVLLQDEGVWLRYDGLSLRWRLMGVI